MKPRFLLGLICVLFLFTRLYKITEIPPSVYWDEASIGYNAYSIAKDGKDEWGEFLPTHFRAFGEFKLPVYIYSVVPFVKIFGLNEFSVRIPAVLFSLGVVILTYLLARRLTGSEPVGLLSAFFITISPWFFIFSRTGYEVTAGLMFYLLGIYFVFNRRNYFIVLSVLSFILSAYSYNSFRIIIPLTILLLLAVEWKRIRLRIDKWMVVSVLAIILSIIPIYRLYVYDAGGSRLQTVGGVFGKAFAKNYFSHFDPSFLFIQGDRNLRHQQMGFGQLHFPEVFLLAAGIIYMLKSNAKYRWLPIMLVLLSPIPAAITRESPHALRGLSAVPFICMLSAMGVAYYFSVIPRLNRGIWIPAFVGMTVIVIFLTLFLNYFLNFLNVYPIDSSKEWQYGYKKIFTDTSLDQKDRVLISDQDGQPYIFALFYLKNDPQKFRDEVERNSPDKWGFSTVKSFGKFEFGKN